MKTDESEENYNAISCRKIKKSKSVTRRTQFTILRVDLKILKMGSIVSAEINITHRLVFLLLLDEEKYIFEEIAIGSEK